MNDDVEGNCCSRSTILREYGFCSVAFKIDRIVTLLHFEKVVLMSKSEELFLRDGTNRQEGYLGLSNLEKLECPNH